MLLFTHIITGYLFVEYVYSLSVLSGRRYPKNERKDVLNDIIKGLKYLVDIRRDGRELDSTYIQTAKLLFDNLKKDMTKSELKLWLRQHTEYTTEQSAAVSPGKDRMSGIIESELKHAIAKKASALFDRPYLQKKGTNEFLVINPEAQDPFVTVIPNDIYYNHEKKCVNWLDDCNAQGIRAKLLQKIQSPYK